MIGGTDAQAQQIAGKYGLTDLQHHNPPMGFIKDPAAVEDCLKFIESVSPFRFCFLAVGSPQQETLAQALRARGVAKGLALCIGASLNFVTGTEKRAPIWMQAWRSNGCSDCCRIRSGLRAAISCAAREFLRTCVARGWSCAKRRSPAEHPRKVE